MATTTDATRGESNIDLGTILVTGGNGGLGRQILLFLQSRGCIDLHSVDLTEPKPETQVANTTYYSGDLANAASTRRIVEQIKPKVVFHVASPRFDSPRALLQKVNVEGTKNLLGIAKEIGVESFIYTSSASVVSIGKTDLIEIDESAPVITGPAQSQAYPNSKGLAENYVLSQNRAPECPNFLTCAIRPCGTVGIGDFTSLPGILQSYFDSQTNVQIGNGENIRDFCINTNMAYAHYLAAQALARTHLQIGSAVDLEQKVDGEAFFITNDDHRLQWEFMRECYKLAAKHDPHRPPAGDTVGEKKLKVIPKWLAYGIACILEPLYRVLGKGVPPLTRFNVNECTQHQYYRIDKAKTRLGYKPLIGLDEGLEPAVEDTVKRMRAERQRQEQK